MSDPDVKLTGDGPETDLFRTDHLGADLKGRSVRGGTLSVTARVTAFLLRMGSLAVLARLLTPADFGLIAMVTAVIGFMVLFKDLGLSYATIQKKDLTHPQVSALFWINVGLSVVILGVTAALSPVIAWFYEEPQLVGITLALAAGFLFSGLTTQHRALLRRQMRFGTLAVVEVSAALAGVGAGIISALFGAGYWALVLMILTTEAGMTVGVWMVSGWRPGFPRGRSGVRALLAFGGYLTGFRLVNYFARNLDNILIGRVWGGRALGLYAKAYNLLLLPLSQINEPLGEVVFPALSHIRDDRPRFRDYYLKSLSMLTLVTAPTSILCLVLADEIILTVLGPQWTEAGDIFRLLAIGALIQPLMSSANWLYIPTGRTRELLKFGSIGVALIVVSFFVGLPHGATGVALCYSCAVLLWAWPCMHFAARDTLVDWRGILDAVRHPVLGALVSGALVLALRSLLADVLTAWAVLLIGAAVMGAAYVLLVFWVF
ncbi:MAG TPA: lipopolysaccharide biosynthesis protein, partial [Planctomycetota bacterium]|nr:lipopolysaccharide biosynthesis protein [Planctomycetota bacterium]